MDMLQKDILIIILQTVDRVFLHDFLNVRQVCLLFNEVGRLPMILVEANLKEEKIKGLIGSHSFKQ